ncbi:MAG TPA: hypothetical protein VM734_08155 [Kofleriaceae bacterium]|jgi:hypothetical protein|nr:hypothetical protein [Kofleriaceae bacterium]
MMLYRGLVVGLLGAIAMLIASKPVVVPAPAAAPSPELAAPRDTIVDALAGVGGVTALLGLGAHERIVAIDDRPCDACEDELEIRWRLAIAREYVDVTIATPRGPRRVLLLAHAAPTPPAAAR